MQDLSEEFERVYSRDTNKTRAIEDKDSGSLVKTIITRYIHCTWCVRFISHNKTIQTYLSEVVFLHSCKQCRR